MADLSDQYKRRLIDIQNRNTQSNIVLRGEIDFRKQQEEHRWKSGENDKDRSWKSGENDKDRSFKEYMSRQKEANGGRISKSDEKVANHIENLWGRVVDSANNGNLATDEGHDLVEDLRKYVSDKAPDYDDDDSTYMNAKASAAMFLLMKAEGNENQAAQMASYIPDYLKHELLPKYF